MMKHFVMQIASLSLYAAEHATDGQGDRCAKHLSGQLVVASNVDLSSTDQKVMSLATLTPRPIGVVCPRGEHLVNTDLYVRYPRY
jgi:hypothetical protein